MTVAELLARMSSREFSEWMAFAEIEPFGEDWKQTGMVTSMIANAHRDPKKRQTPYTPEDFMPVRRDAAAPDNVIAFPAASHDPEAIASADAKPGHELAAKFAALTSKRSG